MEETSQDVFGDIAYSIKCQPKDIETVKEELERTLQKYGINQKLKPEFHGTQQHLPEEVVKERKPATTVSNKLEEEPREYVTKQEIAKRLLGGVSARTVDRFLKRHPDLEKMKITDENKIDRFPLEEVFDYIMDEKVP